MHRHPHAHPHPHSHGHGHGHDHASDGHAPHDHGGHSHGHGGRGHNTPPSGATQWQTPHLPGGPHHHDHDRETSDEYKDLDLVEQAFTEGFAATSDPTSFLRLANVPFTGRRADGTRLHLLRVEQSQSTDIGSVTPHLGGGDFRYAPLPAQMTSRRSKLDLVYLEGDRIVRLSLAEAKALSVDGVMEGKSFPEGS